MGYMGFGLNKWVYNLKPRRPFSKDRKPTGDTISSYEHNDLFTEGRAFHIPRKAIEDLEERKQKIKILERKERIVAIITVLIVISIIIILISPKKKNIDNESYNQMTERIEKKKLKEKEHAYQMMLNYGEYYIKKKDYDIAINEFTQAIKIDPERIEGREGLANVYYYMCLDNNIQCDLAIKLYKDLLDEKQSDLYIKRCAEIYTHLGEFEKADFEYNKLEK